MRGKSIVVLVAVLVSSASLPLTLTGASVALPGIATDLDAGLTPVQWVVTGYTATFASFMLASGSLADLFGRRRVYAAGVGLFSATGLLSVVIGDIWVLNVVRAVAGVGGAAAAASGAALLATAFEGPARARAFGMFGTALGAGLAFGPSVSGTLVELAGWRAAFVVPAVAVLVPLALVPLLPESRRPGAPRLDWAGTASFTAALLLLIFGFVQGPELGWTSPYIVGAGVASAALLAAFVATERRHPQPLFDLSLLANPRFVGISAAAATILCVLIPLLIYLPAYLTNVLEMNTREAGTTLLLLTAPTLALPLLGGLASRWIPSTAIVLTAVSLVGAGAAWLTVISPGIGPLGLAGPLLTIGAGMGVSTGLIDGIAISSVPSAHAGTAAGMLNTARLSSETVAIAIAGAILTSTTADRLADPGYTEGLRIVLWSMAGLAAVTLAVTAVLLRRPPPASTQPRSDLATQLDTQRQ